jgi:hypothetical protein
MEKVKTVKLHIIYNTVQTTLHYLLYPKGGSSKFFKYAGSHLSKYMASNARKS